MSEELNPESGPERDAQSRAEADVPAEDAARPRYWLFEMLAEISQASGGGAPPWAEPEGKPGTDPSEGQDRDEPTVSGGENATS